MDEPRPHYTKMHGYDTLLANYVYPTSAPDYDAQVASVLLKLPVASEGDTPWATRCANTSKHSCPPSAR